MDNFIQYFEQPGLGVCFCYYHGIYSL